MRSLCMGPTHTVYCTAVTVAEDRPECLIPLLPPSHMKLPMPQGVAHLYTKIKSHTSNICMR